MYFFPLFFFESHRHQLPPSHVYLSRSNLFGEFVSLIARQNLINVVRYEKEIQIRIPLVYQYFIGIKPF